MINKNIDQNLKEEMLALAKYAFHKPVTGGDEAFFALLDFAKPYFHQENEQLTSMIIDLPFDVYWENSSLKMSGIGYVSTYPEYRGNGAIRQLMTQMLQEEYQLGTALSYLAPFSHEFYGKFGYAYTFDRKIYQIEAQHFPKGRRTAGKITRLSFDEALPHLDLIHQKGYNQGSVVRASHIWEYYFHYKSKPYFAVYEENGQAQGYLIYEFKGSDFVIRELIALTDEAKQGLYRFISSHAGSFSDVTWIAPTNENLERDMVEPEIANIQLRPYMQARIVNLSEFLKVNGLPDFSVEIVDDIIPENNVTLGNGNPVKMTIGEFTAKILRNKGAILREYF